MRGITTRFTGLLLVALGAWGGLVPFVGHYFHFALGPDKAWTWTSGRLYLSVLPGVATVLGGLILMGAGPRASARVGALLALAGGLWFAVGPGISELWHAGGAQGAGHGSAHIQMLEMLTYHTGLGAVITALAGYAFPRFPVVEEVAAPTRGRGAAAGAGAGAGALAARRDRRAYDETDEPMPERAESGTHRRHLGRDAAIGAGAAGAVTAEHHHRERVAEEEAGAREPVGGRGMAGSAAEPVGERGMAGSAAEPLGERGAATTAGEPVAERDMAGSTREPVAAHEPVDGDQPVGAQGGSAASATTQTPGAATGTTTGDYPGHSTRRRRGGLLGGLLRR